jgi:hypothetical protein
MANLTKNVITESSYHLFTVLEIRTRMFKFFIFWTLRYAKKLNSVTGWYEYCIIKCAFAVRMCVSANIIWFFKFLIGNSHIIIAINEQNLLACWATVSSSRWTLLHGTIYLYEILYAM